MRKILMAAMALVAIVNTAHAQNTTGFTVTQSDPTGNPCGSNSVALQTPAGKIYPCQNGAYAAASGGSAGPTGATGQQGPTGPQGVTGATGAGGGGSAPFIMTFVNQTGNIPVANTGLNTVNPTVNGLLTQSAPAVAISAVSSNANPCVVTSTAHGLTTGQPVYISGFDGGWFDGYPAEYHELADRISGVACCFHNTPMEHVRLCYGTFG